VITTLAVSGYRSLRDVVVPLHGLDVVTGANGTGKSSLYRALRLVADIGSGRVAASLAAEGGLPSVLWAGPETLAGSRRRDAPVQGTVRRGPVSLRLGFASDTGFSYLVDLGLPQPTSGGTAFLLDPEIKREWIGRGPVARPAAMLVERKGPLVRARDGRSWTTLAEGIATHASVLTEVADPFRAPEVYAVREAIRGWRFYDGFRVDRDSPARRMQVGTRTPVLDDDGSSLAAALQTIIEIGDSAALATAVADAFDGARISVTVERARFDLALHQPGMLRPLGSSELSDGTLRYLLLVAALLTPRPPGLMVLNEPETSLHPELIPPLARLVQRARERTQVVVVSHADGLLTHLGRAVDPDEPPDGDEPTYGHISLRKDLGETFVDGQGLLMTPAWDWGSR
jgi:predicted ATPase